MFNVPSTLNGVCNLEHWYWQSQPKTNEKYIQKRAQYQTLVNWKRLNGLETCKYYFLSKRNDSNKHWNNVLYFPAAPTSCVKTVKGIQHTDAKFRENQPLERFYLYSVTVADMCKKTIHERLQLIFNVFIICIWCLQCFDTVGWAAGRASGL